MAKKIFTQEQMETLTAEEVIDKIQHENYSLLKTLGAEGLRKEMVPVGKACHTAINYFLRTTGPKGVYEKKLFAGEMRKNGYLDELADENADSDYRKHQAAARKKLVKVLSKITPGDYEGFPHDNPNGIVVGFNHPSLGEIARILTMKIDIMGDKPMLFPVNLPWYEALAPDYEKIKMLGIIITPTITPSTWAKMNLRKGTPLFEAGSKYKREFRDLYTRLSHKAVKEGGVIFVAPSATRQTTVFKTKAVYDKEDPIIPTMSVLALSLYADPEMKCDFLPMAILPPKDYKRGLNFYKKYTLIAGEPMTAAEIRKKYMKDKTAEKLPEFDYDFHLRVAEKLPKEMWY
ncbi:hypothetical protein IKE79_01585 [Candidatus Saccharibacteria bacterium]|nr:hypothetical protein [Candidatus Saccharibacteria bacterium]